MSLAAREKRTIIISATILFAVLGYMYVFRNIPKWIGGSDPDQVRQATQFKAARDRITQYNRVTRDLNVLRKELNVEVADAPASEQTKKLIEKFEQASGKSKVKINNFTFLQARTRRATAGSAASQQAASRTEIKINVSCENDAALVRFIDTLESETIPIVFDIINITATGSRGSEGGGSSRGRGGQKRTIQADLNLHTYLFPEKAAQ